MRSGPVDAFIFNVARAGTAISGTYTWETIIGPGRLAINHFSVEPVSGNEIALRSKDRRRSSRWLVSWTDGSFNLFDQAHHRRLTFTNVPKREVEGFEAQLRAIAGISGPIIKIPVSGLPEQQMQPCTDGLELPC